MTIQEFKKFHGLKESEKTIRIWIDKGYIKGAIHNEKNDTYYIPKYSLPPYTKHRKSSEDKIFINIAKAVLDFRDIIPELFYISPARMNNILKIMEAKGFISSYKEGKYKYYSSTVNTRNVIYMKRKEIVELLSIPMSEIVLKYANSNN